MPSVAKHARRGRPWRRRASMHWTVPSPAVLGHAQCTKHPLHSHPRVLVLIRRRLAPSATLHGAALRRWAPAERRSWVWPRGGRSARRRRSGHARRLAQPPSQATLGPRRRRCSCPLTPRLGPRAARDTARYIVMSACAAAGGRGRAFSSCCCGRVCRPGA
eukprot:6393426-Alexandrium_andersonii.AAC.1